MQGNYQHDESMGTFGLILILIVLGFILTTFVSAIFKNTYQEKEKIILEEKRCER